MTWRNGVAYAHTNVRNERTKNAEPRPRGAKFPLGFARGQGPVGGRSRSSERAGRKSALRTWRRG